MVQQNDFQHQGVQTTAAVRRSLTGAGFALALMALFLAGVQNPDPAWGKFWMIRPLVVVTMAGALGGFINYMLLHYHTRLGLHKLVAVALSVLIYQAGLWLGSVLGLVGTLWD